MMKIGDTVVLKSNPSKIGEIYSPAQERKNRTWWPVKFEHGQLQYVPEDQLQLYNTIGNYTLSELVGANKFSTVNDLSQIITQIRVYGNLDDIIYSMDVTNTDFYAYQFKPVYKIINSPSNSILIADEVGLGKTIEAGLIWTELKQRYDFKRLFIVCPKILQEKWRLELKNKMGVRAEIVKASEAIKRINTEEDFALVCSIQGMRNDKIMDELEVFYDDDKDLIDLLIIDEAHYLRNSQTKSRKCAYVLRKLSDYTVFLSATPIQNKTDDLFSLVNILDDDHFPYEEYFNYILRVNADLVHLRKELITNRLTKDEIVEKLEYVRDRDFSGIIRDSKQFANLIKRIKEKLITVNAKELHKIAYELDDINSLGYIYNRTRKRDVHENRVIRDAIPEKIEMNKYENLLYEHITECVVEYVEKLKEEDEKYHEGMTAFLLCQPQRMLTSSLYSTLRYWNLKKNDLENEDVEVIDEDKLPSGLMQAIFSEVSEFPYEQELFKNDTKFERLLDVINKIQTEYPKEKIVLFSTYVPTLKYLHERLFDKDITSILLTGKVKDKDEVLNRFKHNTDISILLSSEVGSEGVDLQFCRVIINYDLPWNPMRVEQRIGRLDRIGQKSDKILIWNLFHDSTIDDRIYDKLYSKFDVCTSVLGDFEIVLGEMFRKLSIDLLILSPEEQEKRIEQTYQAIVNKEIENERLEASAAEFIAYGDYILEKIQAEKNKRITDDELAYYVLSTLKKLYSDIVVHRTHNINEFSIKFPVNFISEYGYFCNKNGYSSRSRLLQNYSDVMVLFDNKVSASSSNAEVINRVHPIIKFLKEKTENSKYPVFPCAAIRMKGENIGTYLICVSKIFIKGVNTNSKLLYSGCDIFGEMISSELAEDLILKAISVGTDWTDRGGINYRELEDLTLMLQGDLEDKYQEEVIKISSKNFDRAELKKKTVENHLNKKRKKLNDTIKKLLIEKKEKMIPAQKGKFQKLEEKLLFKINMIEKSKELIHDKEDVCAVLLTVEK